MLIISLKTLWDIFVSVKRQIFALGSTFLTLSAEKIAWLVPHQANKRIIDATARRMGIGDEKVMLNIEKYGNTTSGTIPLCLWDYENQLKRGDNLILAAFGGGFTWGAIYLKWL